MKHRRRHQRRPALGLKALALAAALTAAPLASQGGLLTFSTPAAEAGPVLDGSSMADVTAKAVPSVVNVSTTTVAMRSSSPYWSDPFFDQMFGGRQQQERYGHSLGSGVIVSSRGFILTNNHVIAHAKEIKVSLHDGRDFKATVVGTDPHSDLAVLKLKGSFGRLTPIRFGDSSKMRLGDVVLAIGNPWGVGQSVTMGIVSAKGRSNLGIEDYEDFIQTDAAINPGNSGGALINMRGELIGINTAIASRSGGYQGIGFAIPTNMAKPVMDSLIAHGKVTRGWLGVSIQDIDQNLADALHLDTTRGVLIADVMQGSPADKGGMERGDVVVRIGDHPTNNATQLRTAVGGARVGTAEQVEVIRDGHHKTLSVVLGQEPSRPSLAQRGSGVQGAPGAPTQLGLKGAPLTRAMRSRYHIPRGLTRGVVVTGVESSGIAAGIGLQTGDVIVSVNRHEVRTPHQLDAAYRAARDKVALLIWRDGATVYVVVPKR